MYFKDTRLGKSSLNAQGACDLCVSSRRWAWNLIRAQIASVKWHLRHVKAEQEVLASYN